MQYTVTIQATVRKAITVASESEIDLINESNLYELDLVDECEIDQIDFEIVSVKEDSL